MGAVLALVLVSSLAGIGLADASQPGGSFRDDDGNIHEGHIEALAATGITRGCNPPANDRFCPDHPVTRGEMAAFLGRALQLPPGGADFSDIDGHIFAPDIARLAAAGVTRGCNPPAHDRFCPDHLVTRGQMAAFLVRALGLSHEGVVFTDTFGHAFQSEIGRLAAAQITRGCNPPFNDRFCPDQLVTRAQMATFLGRALGLDPLTPPPRPCVDINTAPVDELVLIIHISEARAAQLISLRPFASVDDLVRISGIGSARLADIQEQGLAKTRCP